MIPYIINDEAIRDFMRYHGIKDQKEAAKRFGISEAYLSLLLAGKRKLNEELRWRIQKTTGKKQDELFIAQPLPTDPFTHQATAWHKYHGVLPYNPFSIAEQFRKIELETLTDRDFDRNRMRAIILSNFRCVQCNDVFGEHELKVWFANENTKDARIENLIVLCGRHYKETEFLAQQNKKIESIPIPEKSQDVESDARRKHFVRKKTKYFHSISAGFSIGYKDYSKIQ